MCFTITTPEKIAKKDIVCWKLFYKKGEKTYLSKYQDTRYYLNKIYTTKRFGTDGYTINEGRHSYSTRKEAHRVGSWSNYVIAVKCVIPKGAKYYYNRGDKEYVSLAIKLIEEQR